MPEGPEIRLAAEKIAKILVGEVLQDVTVLWPALQHYQDTWLGQRVTKVQSRGKALLTHFENGDILYSHNQLYGRWMTRQKPGPIRSRRSLRLAFETAKGKAHLFSATDLEVLQKTDLAKQSYLSRLGPDLLDDSTSVATVSRRLRSKDFRRRQLASLYLDQSFLAGPGNYLRSEILFCSRLHPRLKVCQLPSPKITTLARKSLEITRRAYQKRGVTVEASLVKRLKDEGLTRRHYRHYVFGRQGQYCRVCDVGVIEKESISNRSVFFCPNCQDQNV